MRMLFLLHGGPLRRPAASALSRLIEGALITLEGDFAKAHPETFLAKGTRIRSVHARHKTVHACGPDTDPRDTASLLSGVLGAPVEAQRRDARVCYFPLRQVSSYSVLVGLARTDAPRNHVLQLPPATSSKLLQRSRRTHWSLHQWNSESARRHVSCEPSSCPWYLWTERPQSKTTPESSPLSHRMSSWVKRCAQHGFDVNTSTVNFRWPRVRV